MPDATFNVRTTREHLPIGRKDSSIVALPAGVLIKLAGREEPVLNVRLLGRVLRSASEAIAAAIDAQLHHAEWRITTDPQVIEEIGMHGDPSCMPCRAAVDQAIAMVNDTKEHLLVGTIYYAA